ncbi:MAG: ATP-binding cassette domain-containing protein [Aquabacterium sp.]|nr:ATP-binding cassette domain-containing protein [Aquabacterium sp.]
MPVPPVLQLAPLHFAYPDAPPLLRGLQLTLGTGTHWLQGDAGSGKTTLLRLLGGDLPGGWHASGPPRLNGTVIDPASAAWRAAVCHADLRGDGCDDQTPADRMAMLRQRHPALDTADWQRHIDGFGMAPHAAKTLFMLSTGMRRKATLAAMLASGATLLLLDEPTAGLDAPSTDWLVQALQARAHQPGCATLMVSGRWPPGLGCAGQVALATI